MRRRTFLLFSLLTIVTQSVASSKNRTELLIIKDVLNHLFPTTTQYNGAKKFGAFKFLLYVSKHPTFDKDDLNFLFKGAKKLNSLEKNFLSFNSNQKEKSLREFEKLTLGQNWLATLLNYGLEAMLGDSIYKGNQHMFGWKNIAHNTPIPTATKPFGERS